MYAGVIRFIGYTFKDFISLHGVRDVSCNALVRRHSNILALMLPQILWVLRRWGDRH